MTVLPIVIVIVWCSGRYVQAWNQCGQKVNDCWMYIEHIHEMHFFNLFCIHWRDHTNTKIYMRQISTKMSAVVIMRTYFRDVINVSAEKARTIIDQGLDDFDSLVGFTKADMKTLCTSIRLPGRMSIWSKTARNLRLIGSFCENIARLWIRETGETTCIPSSASINQGMLQ